MKHSSMNALTILVTAILLPTIANSADCPAEEGKLNFGTLEKIRGIPDARERAACAARFSDRLNASIGQQTQQFRVAGAAAEAAVDFDSLMENRELQRSADLMEAGAIESANNEDKSKEKFKDLGFGIGVGYSFGRGAQRVESAEVVNDVVRVTSDNSDEARILLEAHWFFTPTKNKNFGVGPFASINSNASADAIGSFALGIMFGFRDKNDTSKSSWNVGIGYVFDSDVQVLGDGIVANQPLPEGETEVRFRKESMGGLLVMFSRGF